MAEIIAIFIPIVAIICVIGLPILAVAFVLVKLITSNKNVNLELARQGIIPPVETKSPPNKYSSLRTGILCVGIAIGLIVGMLLILGKSYEDYIKFLIICSSTVLSLGLSYIAFFFAVKNKNLDN